MKGPLEGKQLRKRAEKILSEKTGVPQRISSGDKEKLIHELQVHQIELEMQIDELRKAQAEIEESRSRYVELYGFAPVGYFTLDNKGLIVEANLTGASLLGVERKLLSNALFFHFIIPEDRNQFIDCRRKVLKNPGRQSCELRLKRKGDKPLWVHLEGVAVEAPEGKSTRMRMAASDITERKRLEEALRRQSEKQLLDLSSKLLIFQEMERKAIANEIHDGLLSELAAVKFTLDARISNLEKTNHPGASDFRKVSNILQRTMKEARRIMDRLRPSILDDLGLIPALEGFCREFQESYPHVQVECKMEVREDQIPDLMKVVIFRVAQEALTNSARHGGGTLAQISLAKGSDRIELMVQDNGQGFDLESTKKGVGLESMRERVEISGENFRLNPPLVKEPK